MKRTITLAASLFLCGIALLLSPAQVVASGGCPVSAHEASQILGYAVDLKNLGTMGCNYVGQHGLATVMVNVFPSAADATRRVQQVRARAASAPRRAALAFGNHGATFVQVIVQPNDKRAADALLNAVLGKL